MAWLDGILYETEDRKNDSFFYRYIPEDPPGSGGNLADTSGVLQALKIKGVQNAIMDTFPTVGEPYEVEWVTIAEPNPADDTDSSPLAVGEQAKGAAIFDREEGIWVGGDKVYFDCTEGGVTNLRAGLRVRPWQSDHNAHLPVRQREDAGESGQRRDRAQDRRHLPARG